MNLPNPLRIRGRTVWVRWFVQVLLLLAPVSPLRAQAKAKELEVPKPLWQDAAGKSLSIRYNLTTPDSLGTVALIRDQTGRVRLSVPVATSDHTPGPPPNQVLYLTLTPSQNTLPPGQYVIRTLLTANSGAEARAVIVQPLTLTVQP